MANVFTAPGLDGYLCEECAKTGVNATELYHKDGAYTCVACGEDIVPAWDVIDEDIQDHLRDWYNCTVLDAEDKALLADLYHKGDFETYSCGHCDGRVYNASPENWDNFQGVLQWEGIGELCADCAALCDDLVRLRGY